MVNPHSHRRRNASHRHGRFTHFAERTVPHNGVDLPQSFDWTAEHPQWPAGTAITITVQVDPERGPMPVGIRSTGQRHLDVREALKLIQRTDDFNWMMQGIIGGAAATLAFHRATGGKADLADLPADEQDHYWRLAADTAVAVQKGDSARPQRRRRMTYDLLSSVAQVYREAVAAGNPPTMAVGEHFGVPYSTAGRWVSESRKRGHLGAAVGPVAGEV